MPATMTLRVRLTSVTCTVLTGWKILIKYVYADVDDGIVKMILVYCFLNWMRVAEFMF